MKKKLILILALVLISVVSVLCTIAYLMEDVETENVMTVGSVHIELLEYERVNTETSGDAAKVKAFEDDKLLLPAVTKAGFDYSDPTSIVNWEQLDEDKEIIKAGYTSPIWDPASITNEHDKMVFVRNTGNAAAYVRLYFAFEAGNYVRFKSFQEAVRINYNEAKDGETPFWNWNWDETLVELGVGVKRERYFIATATYYKPLEPNTTTEISLSQIALHSDVTLEEARGFGDEYKVLVKAQAMQCDGFDSADAALEKGFGNAYPFKNVKEVTFTDLPTALHYLNADTSSTVLGGGDVAINLVNSITFGLTADHIDKVREYDGVLVANKSGEAVYTAYAYYVPNGEKYDIYVLADEWSIHAPKESLRLFCNMTALTKVDLANLDVSETTNMSLMFEGCSSLKSLDVKDWDVSKVTNMERMFNGVGITTLDASGWDVGEVTSTKLMFSGCTSLTSVDMTGWKFGKLTTMYAMFYNCNQLTSVDCSDWGVSNVTGAARMFWQCHNLAEADLSGWDLSNLTDAHWMFWNCYNLKELHTSGWSLPKVEDAESMFENCHSLEVLDVSNWNMTNVKAAIMFAGCNKLKALDFSNWKNVTIKSMYRMFDGCNSLANVNVSSWNVSAVTDMTNLFKDCASMTAIDISGWDTSKVTNMTQMFYMANNNTELKTITVGGSWSTASVTTDTNMFSGCALLKGGNGTTYNASKVNKEYARVDKPGAPGYLTEKK